MKHELELHYYIQNCGDGSASVTFCESEQLADFDQDEDNGWGEPCTGSIKLESDSPITVKEEIMTHANYLLNLIDSEDDEKIFKFIEEFYPAGPPIWTVEIDETYKDKVYRQNKVFGNGVYVDTMFRRKEESGEVLETYLNTITSNE
jgi:hypothetical protein